MPRKNNVLYALVLLQLLLVAGCSGLKGGGETVGISAATDALQPIDIRSPGFFWLLQPWKEGKLVTIDGRGRFAEISFTNTNKMRITPLVEFPRVQMDRELMTWPEAGLITSRTADRMHHLAAIDEGKTKSHVPLLTWAHAILSPVLLDPREGLVSYRYASNGKNDTETTLFVYNYKEDKMVYQSPEEFSITLDRAMNNQYALGLQRSFDEGTRKYKNIFYNWQTGDIVENDLTKALGQHNLGLFSNPDRDIHLQRRCLFGSSSALLQVIKMTWDENYSDVKVTPLSYLVSEGKGLGHFILSADGMWSSSLVWGYRGLYNEQLCKRAFFHLDERYPNGISMAVITEDYETLQWDYGAFVQHPVHGICFAQEWHKREGRRDRLYLRLYKMDDVLAEINRRLAEEES